MANQAWFADALQLDFFLAEDSFAGASSVYRVVKALAPGGPIRKDSQVLLDGMELDAAEINALADLVLFDEDFLLNP